MKKAKPIRKKQNSIYLIRCYLAEYQLSVGVEHTPRAVVNRVGWFLNERVRGYYFRGVMDVSNVV